MERIYGLREVFNLFLHQPHMRVPVFDHTHLTILISVILANHILLSELQQKFDVHVLGFIPITTLCMSSRKEKVPQ